ncbi:hypothetical protein NliqN6_0427 [Naganishia liquefaciens]|uniref:Pentacotripeptide-repeat region of PRORP domain-containing protein n=1 Tax=Naganishia liquefaciens TaxID=104408 RepID=A0A8H3YC85_9TREE|nr:hypothetical protein NliqN6_0427 [Naganishia liquefaciens]
MSLRNTCRYSIRHASALSRNPGKGSIHSRALVHISVQDSAFAVIKTTTSKRRNLERSRCYTSIASAQSTTSSQPSLDVFSSVQDNQPAEASNHKQETKSFSTDGIRQVEYDLFDLFSPIENQYSTTASRPTIAQVWKIFTNLAVNTSNSELPDPLSLLFSNNTHHLRKLAPYAASVAHLLEHEPPSVPPLEPHIILARWCFHSSIIFGSSTIPTRPPTDLRRIKESRPDPENRVEGALQGLVRDVPQSRWPSKSARQAPHVFSQSKAERQGDIEQCQRPYLNMLRDMTEASATSDADKVGANIPDVLATLDASIRALTTTSKASTRGHILQGSAIHERAVGPVVELLELWLEAHFSVIRDGDDRLLDSVPEGLAAALRVMHRLDTQELAAKLENRLRAWAPSARRWQDDLADDERDKIVKKFLGACMLRDPNSLSFRLHRATHGKGAEQISRLWEMCSPLVAHLGTDNERTGVLSLFLTTTVTAITNGNAGNHKLKSILSEIYSRLPRPTPLPVYHALLSMYAGINTSPADGNQESGHTTVSSEASLANLISSWSRMREEKVTPDIKAYMLLITGLGKKGDYQALQQAWEELVRDADCKALWQKEGHQAETYPPLRIFNHFISTLFNLPATTGSATLALSLFEYICDPKSPYQPDLFTVNIMLRHYARKQDLQAMMNLMDRLPSFRLAPDLVTYTTLISGLLDAGRPSAAKGILDVMQRANIEPNSYVYSLLIADLAKRASKDAMASAEAMIRQMIKARVKPTAITWTALASGYFRANMVQEGLETMKRARSKGVEMTRVSYNMVLRSILYSESVGAQELERVLRGQSRHAERASGTLTDTGAALLLLRTMIDNHVEPDVDTWFITLDGLSRQGKWNEGENVIRLMQSRRFVVREGSVLARVIEQIRKRERPRSR